MSEAVFDHNGWNILQKTMAAATDEREKQLAVSAMVVSLVGRGKWAECIVILNAALPDADPRKITREDVALLRQREVVGGLIDAGDVEGLERIHQLADALESYLPPEGT